MGSEWGLPKNTYTALGRPLLLAAHGVTVQHAKHLEGVKLLIGNVLLSSNNCSGGLGASCTFFGTVSAQPFF